MTLLKDDLVAGQPLDTLWKAAGKNGQADVLVMLEKMKSLGYKVMLEIIKELGFSCYSWYMQVLGIVYTVRYYFEITPTWTEQHEAFTGV